MKKLVLILLIINIIFLSSCSVSMINIYETDSESVKLEEKDYKFEDKSIEIQYDFWTNANTFRFTILNKTDDPIYIDWAKSHFIVNGYSLDYYNNSDFYTERISFESDDVLISNGTRLGDKPTIQIPPHARITMNKFNVNGLTEPKYRSKERIKTKSYTKEDKTLDIRNYIAYSLDKDFKDLIVVDNDFWLSKSYRMKLKTYRKRFEKKMGSRRNKFYVYDKAGSALGTLISGIAIIGGAVLIAENNNKR